MKTLYGYVFPKDNEWNLEFTWENGQDEFVLNSTENTDKSGSLNLRNELARPQISLIKEDVDSKETVSGAAFSLCTAQDIYNVDGEKIVEAGTELTTLTKLCGIGKCSKWFCRFCRKRDSGNRKFGRKSYFSGIKFRDVLSEGDFRFRQLLFG